MANYFSGKLGENLSLKYELPIFISQSLCGKGFNLTLLPFQSASFDFFINVHFEYFNESFKNLLKNFSLNIDA